jgi:hypothetical protein
MSAPGWVINEGEGQKKKQDNTVKHSRMRPKIRSKEKQGFSTECE